MATLQSVPEPPDQFLCPVSDELMEDPVMLVETGQTYDRESIEDWFTRKDTCPLTGQTLAVKTMVPNYAVRGMISGWVELNCPGATVREVREALNAALATADTASAVSSVAASVGGGAANGRGPGSVGAPPAPLGPQPSDASDAGATAANSSAAGADARAKGDTAAAAGGFPAESMGSGAASAAAAGRLSLEPPLLDEQFGGLSLGARTTSSAGGSVDGFPLGGGGYSRHGDSGSTPSLGGLGAATAVGVGTAGAGYDLGGDGNGGPPDSSFPHVPAMPEGLSRVEATLQILQSLTDASSRGGDWFCSAAECHMWQLQELAQTEECRDVMLKNDVVHVLLQVLGLMPGTDSAAHAATCIARLAVQGPVACHMMVAVRAVDHLVAMITLRQQELCRRAACSALTFLGWNCQRTKQEIIVRLCQEVKQSQNNTNIVLAFRELMDSMQLPDAEGVSYALHMLSEAVQANVLEYFSAKNNRLCPTLALTLDKGCGAAAFAAVCAMKNLATTPFNRHMIVEELVGLLRSGGQKGREQAAWLLWELAYHPTRGSEPNVVATIARTDGLAGALGGALVSEYNNLRELTAGMVQLLTFQDHHDRDINKLGPDVDVDAIRFQLVAGDSMVADSLGHMLSQPRAATQARVIATYALSNLAATRSSQPCAACAASAKSLSLLKRGGAEVCVHNPRMAVASQPRVLATAYDMLYSRVAPEIAAAVALLNNLCVSDETRDKVKLEAKKLGTDNVRQRLLELIADQQLSDQTKNGIRTVLQRFTRRSTVAVETGVICRALKPPKRAVLFKDP